MARIHRRTLRRLGLAVGMLTILAGCPLPLPPTGYPPGSRQNIGDQPPEFIIPGQTTREDALLALGEADGAGPDATWLEWMSTRIKGGVLFVVPPLAPSGGLPYFGMRNIESRRLAITFDESGVVGKVDYDGTTCTWWFGELGRRSYGDYDPCRLGLPAASAHPFVSEPRSFVSESRSASEVAVIEAEPAARLSAYHYIQGIDGQDAGETTGRVRVAPGQRTITVLRHTAGADLPRTPTDSERGCATLRASVAAGGTYLIGGAAPGAVIMTDAQTKAVVAVAAIEPGTFMNSRCSPS